MANLLGFGRLQIPGFGDRTVRTGFCDPWKFCGTQTGPNFLGSQPKLPHPSISIYILILRFQDFPLPLHPPGAARPIQRSAPRYSVLTQSRRGPVSRPRNRILKIGWRNSRDIGVRVLSMSHLTQSWQGDDSFGTTH